MRMTAGKPEINPCTDNRLVLPTPSFAPGESPTETEEMADKVGALGSASRCTPESTGGRRLGTAGNLWQSDQNDHSCSTVLVVETDTADVLESCQMLV